MAFTKERKEQMVAQYEEWLRKSQAIFLLDYSRMNMKEIDNLRAKVREAGGQMHVTKNTLFRRVLKASGIKETSLLEGATICGFAFSDAPALAKVLADATKSSEVFKIKGGYLDNQPISVAQVKALAELPPLPVMRAQLLGTLQAPASKLVRTIAEPARQIAAVVKAYSDKGIAPTAG